MKLCIIYNTAPKYREAIFSSIDKEYDCDWYFGHTVTDIKEMDTFVLKNVKYYKTIGHPDKAHWQRGIIRLLFKKKYRVFLILAETRAISCWLFILLASILCRQKKIYLWTHGWYGKETGVESRLKLWMYRQVAGVFVYGNRARNLLIEKGIDEGKLFTIYNSLDYSHQIELRLSLRKTDFYRKRFNNENPVLIFIGRLTAVKRLDLLIEAVSMLKERGLMYNVVLVGDGTKRIELETLVKSIGLGDHFWFYGACYEEDKNAELIFNADLCVSPGNVGLTAMHTLVFGTPVITHNNFAMQMPEFEAVVPNMTGDFFVYNDALSLANRIELWFKKYGASREVIRNNCFKEIDDKWNPYNQMRIIRNNLVF